MKEAKGWALVDVKTDLLYLPFVFSSRDAARVKAMEFKGSVKVIRIRIEQALPVCRKGCGMVDDVPVFCKRHLPKDRAGIKDMLKGIDRETLAECGIV
jgi:hypothetical protein